MKSLSNYIFEEFNDYRVTDLTATYKVNPEVLIIQAPDSYSESDVQLYLTDSIIAQLPSGKDYSEKFFGKNKDNIYDAYFEYDKFEHLSKEDSDGYEINVEWDKHYDDKIKEEDLSIFKVTNVKYTIAFDHFDLKDENEDDNRATLIKIFKLAESSAENKYPVEIIFDEDSLDFKK